MCYNDWHPNNPCLPVSQGYKYEMTQRPYYLYINMGKIRVHTNQMREKCAHIYRCNT